VASLTYDETSRLLSIARIFQYSKPFYSIVKNRSKTFIFGKRPDDLIDTETISIQVMEKHRVYLERLENSPIKKAAYYQQLKESTNAKSSRALSEITGEDWSYIAKVLKTLQLPPLFKLICQNIKNRPLLNISIFIVSWNWLGSKKKNFNSNVSGKCWN